MNIKNYLNRKIEKSVERDAELNALSDRIQAVEDTNDEQDAALIELAELIEGGAVSG